MQLPSLSGLENFGWGTLAITTRRIIFKPWRFPLGGLGTQLNVEMGEIARFEIGRHLGLFDARLIVHTTSGSVHKFQPSRSVRDVAAVLAAQLAK